MSGSVRVSVSLPSEVVSNLDGISRKLGVSRSGLVAQLLLGAELGRLRALLDALPDQGATEADVKRFRGASRDLIAEMLAGVSELQGGLFDDSAS